MMTFTRVAFAAALIVSAGPAAVAVAAPVQGGNTSAPTVAGKWTMTVKSPHGEVSMGLALQQDGKKITGTLATPHGDDLRVEGEFAGETLTLATPEGGDTRITLTAKLKGNGTLDGYMSSQMGDMTWTAARVNEK